MLKSDVPFGSYYVKKISTDSHYILSDEKYPVTFAYAGQEIPVVELAVNDGKSINFKSYSKSYKMKKRIENPEENRAIFLNVHEAIIDRQTW